MITIAAFYHFADFADYKEWREPLREVCVKASLLGTILIAAEGINSTIAGPAEGIATLLNYIKSDPRFTKMQHKESYAPTNPFKRVKVRLKKEIVTIGVKVDAVNDVGTYVKPQDWNKLIMDPEVIVVDTRNDYEVEAGTFRGSLDPKTTSFGQFPAYAEHELSAYKDKKIAMFCTGGIRCEKATALLRQKGFKQVYHLEGGILKYLELIPADQSLFSGECFVFDERRGVDHGLRPKKRD
jgi:UPF0176 protein